MADETTSLRKSLHIYKGLVEVSGLINSITNYDELLRAILDVARRVTQAEAATLFLVRETGALELVISTRGESGYVEPRLSVPRGKGIAGWVFERGEAVLIPDAYADERFYKEADRLTGFTTRSIICAPLKRGEEIIGVLQILNPRGKAAFEPEDLDGFCAYSNLTATAIARLRDAEQMRAQERVERDIAVAAEIQREILSHAIPRVVPGARFVAHNRPAANVGGDFYGVFVRSPEEIYFAIGDVSGKGISASLLMARALSAMRFVFASVAGPSDALARLNETLCENMIRGMFVTTLVGRFAPASRTVEMASAGHCQPFRVMPDGSASRVEVPSTLPLGVVPRVAYDQCRFVLEPGERLLTYTDGLSESRGEGGDILFDTRILECVAGPVPDAGSLLGRVVDAEIGHRGTGPQLDDLTVLVGGFE